MIRLVAWVLMGVVAPAVLVALLEAALRLSGYGFDTSFFVPVEGRGQVTTNDNFGRRYFHRGLARTPAPFVIATPKPAGTYRIFVLGESAAMGFPEPAFGFPRMLEVILGGRNEVLNAAMTAIDSRVVADIADECSELEPDLFVVLMGNNEVVGPHGPGTAFAPIWLQTTRIGQLAFSLRKPDGEWRGMEMFLKHRVAASDPRLDNAYRNFERNLRRIQQLAVRAIVGTVPVNLRDQPPFAGEDAEAAYRSGDFTRARDQDQLRFRADSRINAITRSVGGTSLVDAEAKFAAEGPPGNRYFYEHVHLRPEGNYLLATLVANRIRRGGPHPSFERVKEALALTPWDEHRMEARIAALMSRPPFRSAVRKVGPAPNPAESRAMYERAVAARPRDTTLRLRYAEFLRETGELARAAEELGRLVQLLPGKKAIHVAHGSSLTGAAALAEFSRALAIDPDFDLAHFGMAIAHAKAGDNDKALEEYARALSANPDFTEARNNLGLLLARLRRHEDAAREFGECVRREPASAGPAYNLGMELARLGKTQDAIGAFNESLRRDPGHAPALHARARLQPPPEAIASLEAAVAADPGFAEAHYDLGVLLSRQGSLDAAISHYREAIRVTPKADYYNNLGTALGRKGDLAGARLAFENALGLDPGHANARGNLERARRAPRPPASGK